MINQLTKLLLSLLGPDTEISKSTKEKFVMFVSQENDAFLPVETLLHITALYRDHTTSYFCLSQIMLHYTSVHHSHC